MFAKPKDYIDAFRKILSINLNDDLVSDYIEIKASRDIIVHNLGEINKLYIDKAGSKARGVDGGGTRHRQTVLQTRRNDAEEAGWLNPERERASI